MVAAADPRTDDKIMVVVPFFFPDLGYVKPLDSRFEGVELKELSHGGGEAE
jgi:hypothetical protein